MIAVDASHASGALPLPLAGEGWETGEAKPTPGSLPKVMKLQE